MMGHADENQAKTDKVSTLGGGRRVRRSADGKPESPAPVESHGIDLDALKEAIKQLPEVDATRAMNLFNRIQSGDYEVDPATVADKLLFLERQLEQD